MNNHKNLRIAISGKSGCGNTTVSNLTAEALGLRFINFTFRSLAQERDMELVEVLSLAAKDDSWDKEVDNRQARLARESETGCVIGSRLAVWVLPEADFKVYLKAKPETRARRISQREGGTIEEVAAFTAERDRQDHERYKRIYNIDNDDYGFVDLVIDTDEIGPEDIIKLIVDKVNDRYA